MVQLAERLVEVATRPHDALLLVDADANHREIFRRRLERRGYSVRAAGSPEEALGVLREGSCAAVVIDPGPEGAVANSLAEQLARMTEPAVIVHSAYPPPPGGLTTWLADEYVLKSADLEPLLAALRRVLSPARTI